MRQDDWKLPRLQKGWGWVVNGGTLVLRHHESGNNFASVSVSMVGRYALRRRVAGATNMTLARASIMQHNLEEVHRPKR